MASNIGTQYLLQYLQQCEGDKDLIDINRLSSAERKCTSNSSADLMNLVDLVLGRLSQLKSQDKCKAFDVHLVIVEKMQILFVRP